MAKRAVIALLTVLLALPAAAAGPALPAFDVLDRLNPVDPLPERTTRWDHPGVTLDAVTYSTIPGYRPLRLDLYRRSGSATPRPLVVFVHGGGWSVGNPRAGAAFRDFTQVLAGLAERGYVVASIEYRLSREAVHPAPTEDLAAALVFLRDNADRLGIDASHIALWGMSAGAHLAALNAMTCEPARCVQGFVGWFGVYDVPAYLDANPAATLTRATAFGCATAPCSAEQLDAASPNAHVSNRAPRVLLLHGLADTSVPSRQSTGFAERLRAAGKEPELILLPGAEHGFIGTDANATRRALEQALTATFDFFDRVLRPASTP
jgi:acetyl esterase/lipase